MKIRTLSTVKGELVPYLIQKQFRRAKTNCEASLSIFELPEGQRRRSGSQLGLFVLNDLFESR